MSTVKRQIKCLKDGMLNFFKSAAIYETFCRKCSQEKRKMKNKAL